MYPDPNSVVDSLKSRGFPSDMRFRRGLAPFAGISGYSGTREQNDNLNGYVKSHMSNGVWFL